MFEACSVSTAVYPNCIEATEFRGCILGYLRNTTEKIPPNAANRPPNQECQACRQSAYKLTDGSVLYSELTKTSTALLRLAVLSVLSAARRLVLIFVNLLYMDLCVD